MSTSAMSTSAPLRLAVASIVRDAADTITDTLASVARIADLVLVVDTGSTDQTRSLATAAGARVLERAWDDDFSAARNHALAELTADWILWLDAGETLTSEAAQALRTFVEQQADPTCAYTLWVAVPAAAGTIAGEQVARVRLMPGRAGLRFTGRVRESLDASIAAGGVRVERLPWTIHRSQRDNDPQVQLAKARRDLHLLDQEIQQQGQRPDLLVALGDALSHLCDVQAAIATYRTAIARAEPRSQTMRAAYYGLLSVEHEDIQSRPRLIGVCSEALGHFPQDAQLLCALGGFVQAENRLDLAERAYRAALEHGEIDPHLWHVPDIAQIAGVCLAMVYQLQEQDDAAQRIYEALLAEYPESVRVRRHTIDLHIKRDQRQQALAQFDRLPRDMPHREALRSAIRGACLAVKKNWIPALAYLQTAYQAGCRDPLCLRWLVISLLSDGQIDAATPILHQWHAADPRNVEARKYLDALAAGTLAAETVRAASGSTGRILRLDPAGGIPGANAPNSTVQAPRLRVE